MYVYKLSFHNYDEYAHIVLQSKIKYTREQLYEILYSVLFKIYKEEEYPPLPCLLDWGDVIYHICEEPYKTWLRKKYFLVPFDFDIIINMEGSPARDNIGNIKCCYKDYSSDKTCLNTYKKKCKWRNNNG